MKRVSANTFLLAAGLLATAACNQLQSERPKPETGSAGAQTSFTPDRLGAKSPKPGSWLVSANGAVCDNGTLRLDWAGQILLEETFPNGAGNWHTDNYNAALLFERVPS